jgi:predicted nucleic acid-binding protein
VIVIDNNVLVQLLTDRQASDRLSHYLQLQDQSLLIPAPVLAEFLAYDFQQRVIRFFAHKNSRSQIVPFDEKAALICGEMAYRLNKEKKDKPRQQAKVDLQVVAITLAAQAKQILTEDTDILNIIAALNLPVKAITLSDLPKDLPLFDQ